MHGEYSPGFCPPFPIPPSCPGTSTVDWGLREAENPSRSQVRRELCQGPIATRQLKPGGGGRGTRDTCPQALGGGGWRWSMREATAVVHKADPAEAGSLGTPGSCAFRGHRSSYFLAGPRGALSHTTGGAGADPSLRPTTLIAVPCFPPSLPPSIFIRPPPPPGAGAGPGGAARPTRAMSHWACWGPLGGGWEPDPGHSTESGCPKSGGWGVGASERGRKGMILPYISRASVSPRQDSTKPRSRVSLTIPSGIPEEPHQEGRRVLS